VPALVTLQATLGAHRPTKGNSQWHPFQDIHGMSGHAFIGAVPWMTAAGLTDNVFLRSAFVTASLLPGLSRINDDKHYFSQVVLGWSLAFLATESVRQTETGDRWFHLCPALFSGGGLGVEGIVRY
jgi:hypothetical protein